MSRIDDKIDEIEKYLGEIASILPVDFEAYEEDFKVRAICERYFENARKFSILL